MIRRRLALVSVALCAVAPLASCGGDASTPSGSGDAGATTTAAADTALPLDDAVDLTGRSEVSIVVEDNVFEPKVFEVDPDAHITFTNQGNNAHNVIPVDAGSFTAIDTGSLDPGMSGTIQVGGDGVYRFYCSIHGSANRGQRGAVIVGATPKG